MPSSARPRRDYDGGENATSARRPGPCVFDVRRSLGKAPLALPRWTRVPARHRVGGRGREVVGTTSHRSRPSRCRPLGPAGGPNHARLGRRCPPAARPSRHRSVRDDRLVHGRSVRPGLGPCPRRARRQRDRRRRLPTARQPGELRRVERARQASQPHGEPAPTTRRRHLRRHAQHGATPARPIRPSQRTRPRAARHAGSRASSHGIRRDDGRRLAANEGRGRRVPRVRRAVGFRARRHLESGPRVVGRSGPVGVEVSSSTRWWRRFPPASSPSYPTPGTSSRSTVGTTC